MTTTDTVLETVNAIYLSDSRRVLATLIRLLGDFDVAEEALHDAFRAALEQWPREGVPGNPRAWLVSAGRFKAIDGLRRQKRFESLDEEGHKAAEIGVVDNEAWADPESGLSLAYLTNGIDANLIRQARRGMAIASRAGVCGM